jgi:hypothetical protein
MSKKEYTFDNDKFGVRSTISRINKFLVFQDLDTKGGESRQLCQYASSHTTPL